MVSWYPSHGRIPIYAMHFPWIKHVTHGLLLSITTSSNPYDVPCYLPCYRLQHRPPQNHRPQHHRPQRYRPSHFPCSPLPGSIASLSLGLTVTVACSMTLLSPHDHCRIIRTVGSVFLICSMVTSNGTFGLCFGHRRAEHQVFWSQQVQ